MQTFLPYEDFKRSAETLDSKRLGKQRVESMQIYKACVLDDYGWKNHPVVKMWIGYEDALQIYMNTMIDEWVKRGFNNTMDIAQIYYAKMKTIILSIIGANQMICHTIGQDLARKIIK